MVKTYSELLILFHNLEGMPCLCFKHAPSAHKLYNYIGKPNIDLTKEEWEEIRYIFNTGIIKLKEKNPDVCYCKTCLPAWAKVFDCIKQEGAIK